jgi:hypothetical protein
VVSKRRRKLEFAEEVSHLAEEVYSSTEKIRLVIDKLSTHSSPAAFYETFLSEEVACRLARRVLFTYTPVHGSWLYMVEIELSVLVR